MDLTCEPVAPLRQNQERFRSPDISRRPLGEEAVAAHTVKKTRRAKSTEPTALQPDDPFVKYTNKGDGYNESPQDETVNKRWSLIAKNYENMSKQELLSNYRLLMNEKLRLERFLSIMTKNNEMARNRLESDLLDAMMCIEDLKQALEIRLARRRKIDPREAEERRYLIRQNKKLLNQLFESAKKIERLEVTKVEMKEQLELLDFQIVEVENQKAMIEEELRKIPPSVNEETQTEASSDSHQLITQLKEQLNIVKSDLSSQKAETAAALAKQSHLDNLVRELRRDNIELRDQLARTDDTENSLAESDKPIAADVRLLKSQLEEQSEHVRELEEKLNSSRLYSEKLECQLQDLINKPSCIPSSEHFEQNTANLLYTMSEKKSVTTSQSLLKTPTLTSTLITPKVDDILLQQTIYTFQSLLDERDQEIHQLHNYIHDQDNQSNTELVNLSKLCESSIQTELNNEQIEKLSNINNTLNSGGHILTNKEYEILNSELKETLITLTNNLDDKPSTVTIDQNIITNDDLIQTVNKLRKLSQSIKLKPAMIDTKSSDNDNDNLNVIQKSSPTPSDSGLQGIASAIRRMTTNFLEKPDFSQQQSQSRNSVTSTDPPVNNLLRRPSTLFNREADVSNTTSTRISFSDPNKSPGILGKVENFFKSTSPKSPSIAIEEGKIESEYTDVKTGHSNLQTSSITVPKISISHQNTDPSEDADSKTKMENTNQKQQASYKQQPQANEDGRLMNFGEFSCVFEKFYLEIDRLHRELSKYSTASQVTFNSVSSQTIGCCISNCSTQTLMEDIVPSSSTCNSKEDSRNLELYSNDFQLHMESLILYSIKFGVDLPKNIYVKNILHSKGEDLYVKPSCSKYLNSELSYINNDTKFPLNDKLHYSSNHSNDFASTLFNVLQKEYQKNFNKFTSSNLVELNTTTLSQFILQTYNIWIYDPNINRSNNNMAYYNIERSDSNNHLCVITTPLYSRKYVRIVPYIEKSINAYLQSIYNNNNSNTLVVDEFNTLCNNKLCENHNWFNEIIRQGFILLQPFCIEWIFSSIDLINLFNHTLQKMKYRLTIMCTNNTFNNNNSNNMNMNKDCIFEIIPSSVINSLCRTSELHNIIYLRILHTSMLIIPYNFSLIINIYNCFVNAINYLLSLSIKTILKITSIYSSIIEPITNLNYIISQLLQLFIQLKYRLWEIIIQPIINNKQAIIIIDYLIKCINSQIITRLYRISSSVNDNQNKIYFYILLFRILFSMKFELYCLTHEKVMNNNNNNLSTNKYGYIYCVLMNNSKNCSITGLWPYDKVKIFDQYNYNHHHHHHHDDDQQEHQQSKSQHISIQQLWLIAIKQKNYLIKLLFHNNNNNNNNNNDKELIKHIKNGLQQIVNENTSININLWLPKKFNSTHLYDSIFWSQVYLTAIIQCSSSGGGADHKNSPLWFLKKLEEIRCTWSSSYYINYNLMYIWCLISNDIYDCNSTKDNNNNNSNNNNNKASNNSNLYHPSLIFDKNLTILDNDLVIQLKLAYFIEPSILFTTISHKTISEYMMKYYYELISTRNTSYIETTDEQKVIESLRCQVESLKQEVKRLQRGTSTIEERNVNDNVGEFHISHSSPSHFYSMDPYEDVEKMNKEKLNSSHNPSYYSTQLQQLKETGDLELVRAHLSLSERRRRELERRITELTDELARSRAEARSTETSLSAARRTEAALRRRLLVAMDSRNSPIGNYEMNTLRNSHEMTTVGSSETLNIVELQADIIKLQATNASLNEAALLDRSRLHDQAMRIDQLESEHKGLLDRISCLQAAETGAQRGIVRLQALYEDMLREYSESQPFELTSSRERDRQRSSSRSSRGIHNNDNGRIYKVSHSYDVRQMERQISELQAVNASLKQSILDNSIELSNATSTTIPVGVCHSPACTAVRNLLKAFQDRYSNLMNQYMQSEQHTILTNDYPYEMNTNNTEDNNSIVIRKSSQTPAFIDELHNQLTNLSYLLNENMHNNRQEIKNYELNEHVNMCLRLIDLLDNWIKSCLTENDMEIAHLRSVIMNLHMSTTQSIEDQQTTVFTSSVVNPANGDDYEQNNKQTFSCSISLSRKQDPKSCIDYKFKFLVPYSHYSGHLI
ncbi:unnamed protein product [Heterobilharzia americana]|nr:unnamed protein product [Heterobilharzia americana]